MTDAKQIILSYSLLVKYRKTRGCPLKKVVAPSITFNVETLPNEAVVMVKSVQGHGLAGDILVKVSLTSLVVREEQLAAAAAAATVATVATNGTASTVAK
ncbi:hypothetical protein OUZ56_010118 [Daphnia magna]|uniref:Uncharacterized protein n=1 Tax=Daphnia magna TaxID=35525 RepID=A0ABR0AHU9_9CRUS|nr:hypothetical protein OUZ56_010118 [Daphnia magna]